jgi:hypothetical protein
MTHARWSPRSKITLALGITLLVAGCTGNISTPIPPGPNAASVGCPLLPATIPRTACPGVRFTSVLLTCGGTGMLPASLSTAPGGATRIAATLADGSVLTGSGTPVNPACFDGVTVQIGVTLGVIYTADQGMETTGPSAGTACIVRSRADFTQFVTTDPLLAHPGVEQAVKERIHAEIDTRVIAGIFRAVGATTPARCARWRLL